MEMGTEFEGFVSRVIEQRKNDERWDINVETDELSFKHGDLVRSGNKSRKEKCEIDCVNDGNHIVSSCWDVRESVVKSSVNADAYVKSSEEDDEAMVIQDTSLQKDVTNHKRKRDCLSRMLHWVARIAKDPTEAGIGSLPESSKWKSYSNDEYWKQVLYAREMLFLKRNGVSDGEHHAWKKHSRMHPSLYDDPPASAERLRCSSRLFTGSKVYSPCLSSSSLSSSATLGDADARPGSFMKAMEVVLNQRSLRRDTSLMKSICPDNHVRKRIPVGQYFQAEVPEWSGVASESDPKWLGMRVWPLEKRETKILIERDAMGKGRIDSCGCENRGSIECVRFHVAERRKKAKLELGSAFYHWNFDKMGEEVTLCWSEEEESKFRSTVKANPHSENKCFWGEMFKSLPTKSWQEQISYYYNVFLLHRRGFQNRCAPGGIDSDDDETEFQATVPRGAYSILLGTPRKGQGHHGNGC